MLREGPALTSKAVGWLVPGEIVAVPRSQAGRLQCVRSRWGLGAGVRTMHHPRVPSHVVRLQASLSSALTAHNSPRPPRAKSWVHIYSIYSLPAYNPRRWGGRLRSTGER